MQVKQNGREPPKREASLKVFYKLIRAAPITIKRQSVNNRQLCGQMTQSTCSKGLIYNAALTKWDSGALMPTVRETRNTSSSLYPGEKSVYVTVPNLYYHYITMNSKNECDLCKKNNKICYFSFLSFWFADIWFKKVTNTRGKIAAEASIPASTCRFIILPYSLLCWVWLFHLRIDEVRT